MNKAITTPQPTIRTDNQCGTISKRLDLDESKAIDSLRWVCVISVVMLHSGVAHLVSIESVDSIKRIHEVFTMVPSLQILFILSGYLFFVGYGEDNPFTWKDYRKKCKKRIKTLLIPYFIWCFVGLIFGLFVTHEFSLDCSMGEFIKLFTGDGICGHPCGRAMWYIKSLIVFCILSPCYYHTVRLFKHLTPILAIICIINVFVTIDNALFNPYILLGAYLSYHQFTLNHISFYFSSMWKLIIIVFIALVITNTYIFPFENLVFIVALIGLFCMLKKNPLNESIVKTSTFIYFSHMYITGGTRNYIVHHLPDSFLWYIAAEWITLGITLTICLLLYYGLSKCSKQFLSILTGNRC